MMDLFREKLKNEKQLRLNIHVLPRKSKQGILDSDILALSMKVALTNAPDHGKANTELIDFLHEYFHVPQKNIKIIRGKTSRHKQIKIVCP